MATRSQELDTIGDVLAPAGATALFKQEIPKEYVLGSITIRGISDGSRGLNNVHYSVTNTYQIMYFDDGYISVMRNSETISEIFNNLVDMKLKIRGINEYITIQSFSMSAPFKTDTDGVYGVIGTLTVRSNRIRRLTPGVKMQEVNVRYE